MRIRAANRYSCDGPLDSVFDKLVVMAPMHRLRSRGGGVSTGKSSKGISFESGSRDHNTTCPRQPVPARARPVALVTGAADGIGWAPARALAGTGYAGVLADLRADVAAARARELAPGPGL